MKHSKSPTERSLSSQERHDLANALRTLEMAVQLMEEGYRFQDPDAPKKIASLKRAVGVLKNITEIHLDRP